MAGWLDGKVALVTGGAAGIGRAVVARFVAEGARVAVLDRDAGALGAVVTAWPTVLGIEGDVTRWPDNEEAVARALTAFGRLDIFVGNAGIFDGFTRLIDLPGEVVSRAYAEIFDVNVKGYLLGARAAAPAIVRAGGAMVFTTSSAGVRAGAGGILYSASKHAIVGIIRQLAFELAPRVRVNGVAPGGTATMLAAAASVRPFATPIRPDLTREERIRASNPLGAYMQPEDHAAAYVLLASDRAPAVTGTVVESDGGLGVRGLWDTAGGRDLPAE